MLLDDDNSDEDFFHYKINAKDHAILQKAKAQELQQQQQ